MSAVEEKVVVVEKEKEEEEEEKEEDAVVVAGSGVESEDVVLAKKFIELQKTLYDVKRELNQTPADKYPFSSAVVNQAAKALSSASITTEVFINSLLIEVLHCKKLSKVEFKRLSEPEKTEIFEDIAVFQAWFQNLHSLHGQHIQAFMSLLEEFVKIEPSRDESIRACLKKRMKCVDHGLPAVGRSLDGKKLQCGYCIAGAPPDKPLPLPSPTVQC